MASFSEQQLQAGNELINCYSSDPNGIRWCTLCAQMQSGKTETFLFVCYELLRMRMIETGVIFSGNAETDLREQLKNTINGSIFRRKYERYLIKNFKSPN